MPVSRTSASITAIIAFMIGASVAILLLQRFGVFEPVPYRVLPDTVKWNSEWPNVEYKAQFIKDDCEFREMVVRGVYFGEVDPRPVPWQSIHGAQGDREKGQQGLHIRIGPMPLDYEVLEIRTRHNCEGAIIPKLFGKVELH